MNASKETAKHALENLINQERFLNVYAFNTIKAFLEAAIKKLPTEAAYEKDKKRKEKKT